MTTEVHSKLEKISISDNVILNDCVELDKEKGIYTSERNGCDEMGNGTQDKPYQTVLQAMRKCGTEPFPNIYVDAKESERIDKTKDHSVLESSLMTQLDSHLAISSYIEGCLPSSTDLFALDRLEGILSPSDNSFPHLVRWQFHIIALKR